MAAAARPGSSETARVPCPLCGGLVHPIAGKCKHCKADLTSHQTPRPPSLAPLPAMTAGAPAAVAVAAPPVVEPPASGWRSWPVVVIGLAMIAIVVAVVLMVWPAAARGSDGKHTLGPPPAPERMQTAPDVATPPSAPSPAPRQRSKPPATGTRDPWADDDPPAASRDPAEPRDPADLGGGGPHADVGSDVDLDDLPDPQGAIDTRSMLTMVMAEHMCRKILQCGGSDPSQRAMCDSMARQGGAPPVHCPAADRCLALIDAMACTGQNDLSLLTAILARFQDCADATRC